MSISKQILKKIVTQFCLHVVYGNGSFQEAFQRASIF